MRHNIIRLVAAAVLQAAIAALPLGRSADLETDLLRMINSNEFSEASTELNLALEDDPSAFNLQNFRTTLAYYFERDKQFDNAAQQMDKYVEFIVRHMILGEYKDAYTPMSHWAQQLGSLYFRAEKGETGLKRFDELMAELRQAKESTPKGDKALADLVGAKAILLINLGRRNEAESLVSATTDSARKEFVTSPDDVRNVLRLAYAMAAQRVAFERIDEGRARSVAEQHAEFLTEHQQTHPKNGELLWEYGDGQLRSLEHLMRDSQFTEAEKLIGTHKAFLIKLDSGDSRFDWAKDFQLQRLESIAKRIEGERHRTELIGKAAPPLGSLHFVNCDPLSQDDLKDKVVLLDFWAVWCGPCIATFPQLRTWDEQYRGDGLVIIGLTQYYDYDWDPEVRQSNQVAELSDEQERVAIGRFADHHQLKYPLAVAVSPDKLKQQYAVSAIPHAVLIDRQGVVRMVRVGAADANARDLEAMIQKLLGEDAARSP